LTLRGERARAITSGMRIANVLLVVTGCTTKPTPARPPAATTAPQVVLDAALRPVAHNLPALAPSGEAVAMFEASPDVVVLVRDRQGVVTERIVVPSGPVTAANRAVVEAQLARVTERLKGYQPLTPVVFAKTADPDELEWKRDELRLSYRSSEHTYHLAFPGIAMTTPVGADDACETVSTEPRAWVAPTRSAFWITVTVGGAGCAQAGARFELLEH